MRDAPAALVVGVRLTVIGFPLHRTTDAVLVVFLFQIFIAEFYRRFLLQTLAANGCRKRLRSVY
ncbi:hypothetical protein [Acidiphilium sp.]|uniref:hypothetical protein n=1 Tax=Acidiphilium sp. TaxID=527 RepID=UPI003CFE7F85